MSKSKQELIQEAIKVFDGALSSDAEGVIVSTETNTVWGAGRFQVWDSTYQEFVELIDIYQSSDAWDWVCSREEFEQAVGEHTVSNTEYSWYDNHSFPPAGTRCEVMWYGEWIPTYIVRLDEEGAVVYTTPWLNDCTFKRNVVADLFRPLRTEAERKRDEIIDKIDKHDHNVDLDDLERIIDILMEEELIVDRI